MDVLKYSHIIRRSARYAFFRNNARVWFTLMDLIQTGYLELLLYGDYYDDDEPINAFVYRMTLRAMNAATQKARCAIPHALDPTRQTENFLLESRPQAFGARRRRGSKKLNRWSRDHECCRECGTTERTHNGRGLCTRCAARAGATKSCFSRGHYLP
jgi:hypothetical protein